jgi:hypothetical protein
MYNCTRDISSEPAKVSSRSRLIVQPPYSRKREGYSVDIVSYYLVGSEVGVSMEYDRALTLEKGGRSSSSTSPLLSLEPLSGNGGGLRLGGITTSVAAAAVVVVVVVQWSCMQETAIH